MVHIEHIFDSNDIIYKDEKDENTSFDELLQNKEFPLVMHGVRLKNLEDLLKLSRGFKKFKVTKFDAEENEDKVEISKISDGDDYKEKLHIIFNPEVEKKVRKYIKMKQKIHQNWILFTPSYDTEESELNKGARMIRMMGMKNVNKFMNSVFKEKIHLARTFKYFLGEYQDKDLLLRLPHLLVMAHHLLEKEQHISIGHLYKKILASSFDGIYQIKNAQKKIKILMCNICYLIHQKETNSFSIDQINHLMIKEKDFPLQIVLSFLVEKGLIRKHFEKEKTFYSVVHQDVIDYYSSIKFSQTESNFEKMEFFTFTIFLAYHLRKNSSKIFSLFDSIFRDELIEKTSEISIFLNQLPFDSYRDYLKKKIESLNQIGFEMLVGAVKYINYPLFKLFNIALSENDLDELLLYSPLSHPKIVMFLLEKKLSLIANTNSSQIEILKSLINKIETEGITFDVSSLLSNNDTFHFRIVKDTESLQPNENEIDESAVSDDHPIDYDSLYWKPEIEKDDFILKVENKTFDLNKKDTFGNTPLYYATEANNVSLIDYILSKGVDSVEEAFISACNAGKKVIVELFIHKGLDPSILKYHSSNFLLFVKNREIISFLIRKIYHNNYEMNRFLLQVFLLEKKKLLIELLKNGADPSFYFNEEPVFHQIFKNNKINHDIFKIVDKISVDFNLLNLKNAFSCLHYACQMEDIKIIRDLCLRRVSLNPVNNNGCSPLDLLPTSTHIKELLHLGFRAKKKGGLFLLKKVVVEKAKIEIRKEIVSSLLVFLETRKYDKFSRFCVSVNADDFILQILLEFTLKKFGEEFTEKNVRKHFYFKRTSFYLNKENLIDPKDFILSYKKSQYIENFEKLREIIEFNPSILSDNSHLISAKKRIQLEQIETLIKNENDLLEKNLIQNLERIKDFVQTVQNSKKTVYKKRDIVFIDTPGISMKSKIINRVLFKALNLFDNLSEVSFFRMKPEEWEHKKHNLNPWVVFITAEVRSTNKFCYGKKEIHLENFCQDIDFQKMNELSCIFVSLLDYSEKYHCDILIEQSVLPPWVVFNRVTQSIETPLFFKQIFQFITDIFTSKNCLRDACNKAQNSRGNKNVRVIESFNFSSVKNEHLYKQLYQPPEEETYLNFKKEKTLKRAAFYCNFQKRQFALKSTEYVTLFKKFTEIEYKKRISFFNGTPYNNSYKEGMSILERLDKSFHPWVMVASFDVKENNILIDENDKKSNFPFNFFFEQVTEKIGFLSCVIIFQNEVKDTHRRVMEKKVELKTGSDLLTKEVYGQLYECAEVVIINDKHMEDKEKQFFLENFFNFVQTQKCSFQMAYTLIQSKLGNSNKMKMICRPVDFIFEKSLQRFFLDDQPEYNHQIYQRAENEKNLLKACNQLNPNFLKYFQHINLQGVNYTSDNGKPLLVITLMRDLFHISRILLNFSGINVNMIDPQTGIFISFYFILFLFYYFYFIFIIFYFLLFLFYYFILFLFYYFIFYYFYFIFISFHFISFFLFLFFFIILFLFQFIYFSSFISFHLFYFYFIIYYLFYFIFYFLLFLFLFLFFYFKI